MRQPKAFIFDLDGVLTDTANYHYLAWKKLAEELGLEFNQIMNEKLKGVSRMRSLEIILEENGVENQYTEEEKENFAAEKNNRYVASIDEISEKDILPGVLDFLKSAKERGILLAVASASKNVFSVIDRLGIKKYFDYIADANLITQAKPDPEVFLNCINYLQVEPSQCIGFEDAEAGIQAIQSAGIHSVGIGIVSEVVIPKMNLRNTQELDIVNVIENFNKAIKNL